MTVGWSLEGGRGEGEREGGRGGREEGGRGGGGREGGRRGEEGSGMPRMNHYWCDHTLQATPTRQGRREEQPLAVVLGFHSTRTNTSIVTIGHSHNTSP